MIPSKQAMERTGACRGGIFVKLCFPAEGSSGNENKKNEYIIFAIIIDEQGRFIGKLKTHMVTCNKE